MIRVYDPITVFTNDQISKVKYDPTKRNHYLGEIGELLVEYSIKWFFWSKGFRLGRFRNGTFNLITHYKADKTTGTGGIDFYLKFRTSWKTFRIFVEVKNWDDWLSYPNPNVSDDRYKKQILSRFTDYDWFKLRCRVLVIPKGYFNNLESRCDRDDIKIISLDGHLMPELLCISFVDSDLKHFIRDFSEYIDSVVNNGLKTKSINNKQKTKNDKILDELKQGMPPELIAKVNETSVSYVYKVKSKDKKYIF